MRDVHCMLIEWARVSVPLAVVVISGAIAWLSALAVRRRDRLVDGRAALVAAFEECLSATEYFYEDLKIWQSAWAQVADDRTGRASVLAANISDLKRQMFATRGRLRAALVRLAALDSKADLSPFQSAVDELVVGPYRKDAQEVVTRVRVQVLNLVAQWRKRTG